MGLSLDLVNIFYLWVFSYQLFFFLFSTSPHLFLLTGCLVVTVQPCIKWIPIFLKKNISWSFSSPLMQFIHICIKCRILIFIVQVQVTDRDTVFCVGYWCLTKRFIPQWRYWSLWTVPLRRKNHSWNKWRLILVWFAICNQGTLLTFINKDNRSNVNILCTYTKYFHNFL